MLEQQSPVRLPGTSVTHRAEQSWLSVTRVESVSVFDVVTDVVEVVVISSQQSNISPLHC